jgi:hypothetical protein
MFLSLRYIPLSITNCCEKPMAKYFFSGAILHTVIASLLVLCSTQCWQSNSLASTPTSIRSSVTNTRKSAKKAMTWVLVEVNHRKLESQYFQFGRDYKTNAYKGDTAINQKADLLCIEKKANLQMPSVLPKQKITDGGAWRGGWSGRQAIIIPNVTWYFPKF